MFIGIPCFRLTILGVRLFTSHFTTISPCAAHFAHSIYEGHPPVTAPYRLIWSLAFTDSRRRFSLFAMYSMYSDIFSPEVTAAAERAYQLNNDAGNSNVRVMDPHPSVSSNLRAKINTPRAFMQTIIQESMKPKFPPPENLPCANVEVAKYRACKSPGKLACSVCKLVSYCSKVCGVR